MRKILKKRLIIILGLTGLVLSFFQTSSLLGFSPEDYRITAKKISRPLRIDGILDESSWKRAELIENLIQREPEEGKPSTERTEIRILYDDEYLYFGFICFDREPQKIVANEMRRDADLRDNDYVEIIIDSFHDHRNAFYFAVNPLGAQIDSQVRDEGASINRNWDGIWLVRTQRDHQGWSAEIAIPFYTLRFSKEANQTWGINFCRNIARKREENYWTPILRSYGFFGPYKVSFYGHLAGLYGLRQGRKARLIPYVIGGANKPEKEASFAAAGDLGLDLKYSLASNLTADLTLNTDFAQVEADQEQFNLTRFSLFFPEKREFFLEGADIFRFGERYQEHEPPSTLLFFSRTIGLSEEGREIPIIGGIRVTGKAGQYDLGILDILTDRVSYQEEEEEINIGRTNYAVLRLKRDIFEKSSIGIIALSKDSLSQADNLYNRAAGFDFNLAFGSSFQSGGFLAKSFSPSFKGKDWAGYLNFIWNSDFVMADFSYTDIGENFQAEMGFIPRLDIRKFRGNFGLGPRPRILNIRQTFLFNNFTYIEKHSGQLESRNNLAGIFNLFHDGSQLFIGYIQNYEFLQESFEIKENVFIPAGRHKFNLGDIFFESDRSKNISIHAEVTAGQFYNGRLFSLQSNGFLKISSHFNMEFIYNRNQFDLPVQGGKFTTNIAASRMVYSLTSDLFAKAYLQWNDSESLFKSNFLIRWIYKPGANLYFIYNETRKLGRRGYLQDRGLMLKVSFLF